ncbi:MAG TPA: aconitate hydratase, partial [Tistrella mobilis]|nr:aconitate hydratase [Tistrella mobilis]
NRNFEGRVNPDVRANYLASPMLVVVYAIAGSVLVDLDKEPLGHDKDGTPVFLRDIWPTSAEIRETVRSVITSQMFRGEYADVFSGDAAWQAIQAPEGETYEWDDASTYVKMPPYFDGMSPVASDEISPINGARALAILGDSVTTDHISPAGNIAKNSPAARYLTEHGVAPADFNSYGARRGNHEVMMRGTFANVRIRNEMVPGVEGGYTRHIPTGEQLSIYDAAMRYIDAGTPLVVVAGKEYGTGSSRDWAAKGTMLLGVKGVIAESFERIHRSNLVGMGILPLVFGEGWDRAKLGLDGTETFDIVGLGNDLKPRQALTLKVTRANGEVVEAPLVCRIDTLDELEYYKNGGILHYVLRRIASGQA